MERLLSKRQLSRFLGVHTDTVTKLAKIGAIPTIQVSQNVQRFDREAVMSALQHRNSEAESAIKEHVDQSKNLLEAWQDEAPGLLEMGMGSMLELIGELTQFVKTWSAAEVGEFDPADLREARERLDARLARVREEYTLLRAVAKEEPN